jgi:hypothetical protein
MRHSFASLLLHEGRDVIYVARQLRGDCKRLYFKVPRAGFEPAAYSLGVLVVVRNREGGGQERV